MARRLPTGIAVGELRHRIQIVQPTPSGQDPMGGVSADDRSQWSVVQTVWASVEAWNGDASTVANQVMSQSSHWITIRHPRVFTPTSRNKVWFRDFTGKNRTFQIDATLNPTENNHLLVLVCTEVNDSNTGCS